MNRIEILIKGIINSNYEPYWPLLKQMKLINDNTLQLINYFDKKIN